MWCKRFITHIILVAAEGLWNLDHCFITTHSIYNWGDLQIYSGVIFRETRHHTQAHITSGAFIHCAFSLASAGHGGSSWASFVVAAFGLPTNLGMGWSWLFPTSSIKFLTRNILKSQWVYLGPHEITVSNCWVLLDPEGGKTISWPTWRYITS